MSKPAPALKHAAMPEQSLREEIIRQAASRFKGAEAKAFAQFSPIYIYAINSEDLNQAHIPLFAYAVAQLWQTALDHKGKKQSVRIELANSKKDGPEYSLIEIVGEDIPFLVDSTTNELHRLGIEIEAVVHPTAYIERDDKTIKAVYPPKHIQKVNPKSGGQRMSFIQFIIKTPAVDLDIKDIKANLTRVLNDVAIAVADWQKMRKKLGDIIAEMPAGIPSPAEREEARQFLEWLDQDHFTFLGYRAYDYPKTGNRNKISVVDNSGLGVITDPAFRVFGDLRDRDADHPEVKAFVSEKSIISISKSNATSSVHRTVPMDTVSIKRYDKEGKVVGEHRFVGLFTSLAYSRNPRDIPLLRQKVDNILKRTGWSPTGHKTKILVDVLVSFPRDELIQIDEDELFSIAMGIARIQEKIRTALFVRRDKLGRHYSCLIFTPRENFTSGLREKFGQTLEERLGGKIRNYYTMLSDQPLARIHFIIDCDKNPPESVNIGHIEKEMAEMARSWSDRLREAVLDRFGADKAPAILRRYAAAFSLKYQNTYGLKDAMADIENTDATLALAKTSEIIVHIYPNGDAGTGECGVALYKNGAQLVLSEILPSLENMGFRVLSETAMPVTPTIDGKTETVWSHDLTVQRFDRQPIDVDKLRDKFTAALAGVYSGEFEDDGFNRLIVSNNMTAREVVIFRSYAKYLRQIGFTISQNSIERCLAKHADITKDLLKLFYAYFDPKSGGDSFTAAKLQADILIKLDKVTNVDEDRIMRKFLNLISASLRTNFFQTGAEGRPKNYFSVKLSSRDIIDLPEPKPWCEIFVCSPRMEAIHLRGGKVARGGIRWSDRREDFRTEVLSLVKAQMVKNTVIVPVGSKGGFVLKQPPEDKKALSAEVTECYKTMMRGMLDITDNLQNGKVIPPQNVVRRDADDPYLVVAADKGTAKFSDTANSVSAEYGFWLGDAFASGGSAGYDHKELSITARGGWVSVMRHFREMDVDIRKTQFSAIGVGDMAGDVFGNGMLQSDQMKLLAAFNHAHIFVDPNPDPAKSYKERKRLFENPQLSWADYDSKTISKGGGVFGRDKKKITLSTEARAALQTEQSDFTPAELIQTILRAPADLLWLGGIGTFVKASHESNSDVGDRGNDNLRINAKELRCKIVGEGANLGFTQLGRIEYALSGGRNNTDAIDNSGGVDCSDHEVNIKILLSRVEQDGRLTRKDRDKLLKQMSVEVCDLVLRDNYEQTMALSCMVSESAEMLDEYARHIRILEKSVKLSRTIEYLPSDEEIAERSMAKQGLTRPELAVLLAYTKMGLYDAVLASTVPDDPALETDLRRYFPKALQDKYAKDIGKHALRREIIATCLVNYMVNRVGILFAHNISEITGSDTAEVIRAYIAVRELFGLDEVWSEICALDYKTKPVVQIHMIQALNRFVERATIWFLRSRKSKQTLDQVLAIYQKPIMQIQANLRKILPSHDLKILDRKAKDYAEQNVVNGLASRVVFIRMLGGIGDVINIAETTKKPASDVAGLYFMIGERFGLDWMRRAASKISRSSAWQARAVSSLIDDLLGLQARLTKEVVREVGAGEKSLQEFIDDRAQIVAPIDALLAEIRAVSNLDTAMITVAIAKIRTLLV
ncbi:MAG: NAD-glutamate dehydrogenase [Alphaproteobacteria bacterium]|nr:MAG: NAD-glutamate dehydrogenase [Alphaproteobacteria bacterium]